MEILAENEVGFVGLDGNELIVGSKIDDPPKLRLTAPMTDHGGGGGVVSFSRSRRAGVVVDGHEQDEMGFVRIEQSESVRGDPNNLRSEFNILLHTGDSGDDVHRGIALETDCITKINPGLAADFGIGSGDGASSSRFESPNGRYWVQMQNDGNFVIYDALDPAHPKVLFDLWWLLATLAALGHPYPH